MTNHVPKQNYPETEKFLAWYTEEKKKGLVDVKFCPKETSGSTVESFFGEVNVALKSKAVKRSKPL